MYLFYKVVFLAVLFLPWYKGAHYIYRSHLREIFRAYESIMYDFTLAMMEKLKEEIFVDKPKDQKNLSSEEEEPGDSSPDENDNDDEDGDSDTSKDEYERLKPALNKNSNKEKLIKNKK